MEGAAKGPAGQRFTKADRVLSRRDFLRIQSRGRKLHTRHLIALLFPAPADRRRLGLVVSTKVGNSVERNQVKRWLREVFRKERELLPERVDLVLIAKKGAPDAGHAALLAEFREVARKARETQRR